MTKRQRLQLVNNAHKAFKMPFIIFDAEQGDGPGAQRFYIQTHADAQMFIDFARKDRNWIARDAHVGQESPRPGFVTAAGYDPHPLGWGNVWNR